MFRSFRFLPCVAGICLAVTGAAVADPPGPQESTTPAGGSARGGNQLNPLMSFNALLRAGWRTTDTPGADPILIEPQSGIALQEAEAIFTSVVDPYFKADAIVAIEDSGDGYETDLEEVFVTALAMPRGFGLRAGKMYLPLGRHNLLHAHQFAFIQAPLVNQRLLGDEGLNEPAIEGSALLPVNWYSQLVVAIADGRNHELFGPATPRDLAFLCHFKNLWDIGESATLEFGTSALYGRRGIESNGASRVFAANATYKWRPARRGQYHALELQAEVIDRGSDPSDKDGARKVKATGGYIHARWQLGRRWWVQSRYDRVANEGGDNEDRWSALAVFAASEFSALRLEYATLSPTHGDRDHQLLAQFNFTIGSHPAHAY